MKNIELRFDIKNKLAYHGGWMEKYKRGEDVYPVCYEVDPSNVCQYNCRHCVWADYLKGKRDMLDKDRVLFLMEEMADLGAKGVVFTGGGEPLTYPHIAEVVSKARGEGLDCGMFTNGLAMTPQRAESLVDNLAWIRFNLVSPDPESFSRIHGVPERFYDVATANIAGFLEKCDGRVDTGIGTAVNEDNFEATKGMVKVALDLGVDFYQVKPDMTRIHSDDYLDWYRTIVTPYFGGLNGGKIRISTDQLDRVIPINHCHAHRVTTAITADGRVAYCKFRRDQEDTSLGNIYDQGLKEILDGQRHRALEQQITAANCQNFMNGCPYFQTNLEMERILQGEAIFTRVDTPHKNFL